ncbi:MAG: sigma-54-dependent Fis family transcriptional regulator [Acidobacteria bacterium]|nr:sigma-54-dependent Fis family transcriptional regulator [Acidobacteriota bacterium]
MTRKTGSNPYRDVTVLYAEDEPNLRTVTAEFLGFTFDTVWTASNGRDAFALFQNHRPDLVVTDIRMPGMDGLALSRAVKKESPDTPIIIMTAFSEPRYLIEAIDIGVDGFISKPPDSGRFQETLERCARPLLRQKELQAANRNLMASLQESYGSSPATAEMLDAVVRVAATDFSVVLSGETGSGKTRLARTLHDLSPRRGGPFHRVDLGSIPETLVESELFGHRRGAFTGAERNHTGFFEQARGGTLLLDELENLTPAVQGKLLACVENRRIQPLGAEKPVEIDVRVMAATNRDIRGELASGRLREDLYYRLCEFEIHVPALRDRPGDIPFFAERFAAEAGDELGLGVTGFTPEAMARLAAHTWPGNIRELRNVVRRAVLSARGPLIDQADLPPAAGGKPEHLRPGGAPAGAAGDLPTVRLAELENLAIRQALRETGGRQMKAAAMLGIEYPRFKRKMKKYGLEG